VPIDILHRREEAAGWVRSVYQQDGKLFAVPEWNNLGKQLVGDKMYRYLSATIDLARNVLRSISLVNFPAVKGLRPVELAEETEIVSDPAPPSQVIQEPGQNTATTAPAQEILTMADEQVVQSAPPPAAPPTPPVAPPAPVALNEADLAGIRANMEKEMRQAIMAEYAQLQASQEKMLAELMVPVIGSPLASSTVMAPASP
jgi:phage I-like protein